MTASSAPSAHGLAAEVELGDPVAGKAQRAQFMLQPHLDVALAQMLHRRLDEDGPKPVARDQRPAGLAAQRPASRARPRTPAPPSPRAARCSAPPAATDGPAGRRADRSNRSPRRPARRPAPTAAAPAADSRRGGCRARGGSASKIHHGRPSLIRSVQRSSDARSTNGNSAAAGPTKSGRAADRLRQIPAPRDCPTAPDDCRCRSSCRWCDRNRSGSGRPDRRSLRARRPVAGDCASRTAAASPARPAPIMWTVRAIR